MTEVYILFGSSIAVMFLAIVTFYVVLSYHKTLKRQRELEEEVKGLKAQGSEEARKIILDAQLRATEVIKNAEVKSQELINASEIFSKEYKLNFQKGLEQEANKMLTTMSQAINKLMVDETARMKETFARSMSGVYSQAQAQVEEYKKFMMDRINQAIFAIVQTAAKKSLKESLSREQHEKIILKALEEAKKEHVL